MHFARKIGYRFYRRPVEKKSEEGIDMNIDMSMEEDALRPLLELTRVSS